MYSCFCLSSVYENWFFDRCCLWDIWIQRESIWIGQEQIWERKRNNYLLNMTVTFNSVIIFQKSHNIPERYYFRTRKHIEVGLKFSLAVGSKMLCISVFMFFKSVQAIFSPGHFWSTGRRIHNSRRYVFLCFLFILCIYVCLWTRLAIVSCGSHKLST